MIYMGERSYEIDLFEDEDGEVSIRYTGYTMSENYYVFKSNKSISLTHEDLTTLCIF